MYFSGKLKTVLFATLVSLGILLEPDLLFSQQADQINQWQIQLQNPASEHAASVVWHYNAITYILTAIVVFVLGLLVYCVVRFNEKSNPNATKTSHNAFLETVWTLVPIIILVVIALPAFRLLVNEYSPPPADVTIKATGSQWYWSYTYMDEDFEFDSVMLDKTAIKDGQPYLLAVNNDVVVPVNKVIKVLITASDVIHSWAMPVFSVKMDAVPGRLSSTWFKATRTGRFYGQCSELCGKNHAYMPIAVRVVTQEEYEAWLKKAKEQFAMKEEQKEIKLSDTSSVDSQENGIYIYI